MIKNYNDFINENIDYKPSIFTYTIYRLPTDEELIEVDSYDLNTEELLSGFRYTMIGRGIKDPKNKALIVNSLERMVELFGDKYKEALERSKSI